MKSLFYLFHSAKRSVANVLNATLGLYERARAECVLKNMNVLVDGERWRGEDMVAVNAQDIIKREDYDCDSYFSHVFICRASNNRFAQVIIDEWGHIQLEKLSSEAFSQILQGLDSKKAVQLPGHRKHLIQA